MSEITDVVNDKIKIGFVGIGKMATAIIGGLVDGKKLTSEIYGYDIHKNNYEFLTSRGAKVCFSLREITETCNFIVLAVKPQNMEEVLIEMKSNFNENAVIVSIAAGINEEFVSKILGRKVKFVQVMPNTPLLLQKGAVAICKGSYVDDYEFNFVKKIFSSGAVVCEVDANQMNDIIAINGSSPAFIYLFTKGFLDFAIEKGINFDVALKLFCASLVGSAHMMIESGKSIDELIKDVSSPGGTTLAGLSVLNEADLTKIVKETCEKTSKRAFELSK